MEITYKQRLYELDVLARPILAKSRTTVNQVNQLS